ncbi:MAG: radical SAM family heme chaperone HemW [Desulfovibrio sp.]|nr:radical SAM family heme chaperone HemW [Desulfovibrio sp.]
MLLYIHVPFCRSRCKYCSFYTQALGRKDTTPDSPILSRYVDTVCQELALWGQRLGNCSISSIFFGGGTPSLLSPSMVETVLTAIRSHFAVDARAEITLEANPESLKGTLAPSGYLAAGINRLSLGVQSLDAEMLRMLGRVHKAQESVQAYTSAREAGFANIGLDLMWGLPSQSVRHWMKTLHDIVALQPEHISCYGLTLEQGTVLDGEVKKGLLSLPVERDLRIMFLEGVKFLEKNGYMQYEISNFARMGYQCRHNGGYWDGVDYVGVGPAATSTIGSVRRTNPSYALWEESIAHGVLGGEEEQLSPLIRVLEMLMLSLRTARGISLDRYRAMTGHDFLLDHKKMVQALHENGLIRIKKAFLRLTVEGMIVSNSILANLFEQTKRILAKETLPSLDTAVWPGIDA